jgi:hypothetical protein
MTTAYSLMDTVIRPRKRPSTTSTSAAITRPIFGASPVRDLPIPVAINAYNYHIGGWIYLISTGLLLLLFGPKIYAIGSPYFTGF